MVGGGLPGGSGHHLLPNKTTTSPRTGTLFPPWTGPPRPQEGKVIDPPQIRSLCAGGRYAYYWNSFFFLDVRFAVESNKDCNKFNDIYTLPADVSSCKMRCASNTVCGGFVVGRKACWLKDTTCVKNMVDHEYTDIYLKEVN